MTYKIAVDRNRVVGLAADGTYDIRFDNPTLFPDTASASKVLCELARKFTNEFSILSDRADPLAFDKVIVKFDSYDGDGIARAGVLVKDEPTYFTLRDLKRNRFRAYKKEKVRGFAVAKDWE